MNVDACVEYGVLRLFDRVIDTLILPSSCNKNTLPGTEDFFSIYTLHSFQFRGKRATEVPFAFWFAL
jgi:hypothetical protein